MNVQIRPATVADAEPCGRIIYDAFKSVADRNNTRPDMPSPEMAVQLAGAFIAQPQMFSIVAESGGRIVGSNFLWEYDAFRAVGPVTVDPHMESKGIGRKLMQAVMERGAGSPGIRLVQDAANLHSLSLYASLGFDVREPLVLMEGVPRAEVAHDVEVRPVEERDLPGCAALSRAVHGFERTNELRAVPPFLKSFVAVRDSRVTAYASAPHFWQANYAVAEGEHDMRALLAGVGAASDQPLSFLLPVRQAALFRWCLESKLRAMKPMTLMTMGAYEEPRGSYLTSVGY
jgi:predicted N-acetyltransferase YhbS